MSNIDHSIYDPILSRAVDEAKRALEPAFEAGGYSLPTDELMLLHEVDFKAGMLREVIANRDVAAGDVERLWQAEKARQLEAWAKMLAKRPAPQA